MIAGNIGILALNIIMIHVLFLILSLAPAPDLPGPGLGRPPKPHHAGPGDLVL